MEELHGQLDLTRLHFPGLINYGELRSFFSVQICIVILRALMLSVGAYIKSQPVALLACELFSWGRGCVSRTAASDFGGLDNQAELNQQGYALESRLINQSISNLRNGLDLDQSCTAWCGSILIIKNTVGDQLHECELIRQAFFEAIPLLNCFLAAWPSFFAIVRSSSRAQTFSAKIFGSKKLVSRPFSCGGLLLERAQSTKRPACSHSSSPLVNSN